MPQEVLAGEGLPRRLPEPCCIGLYYFNRFQARGL